MSLLTLLSSSASPVPPQAASGYFTFADNPVEGDLMPDINGVADIAFNSGSINILIGATLAETLITLRDALNNADGDSYPNLKLASYASDGVNKLLVTYLTLCPAGTDFLLGASTANITRSGAHLTCS